MKVQAAWVTRLKRNEEGLASGKVTGDGRDLLEQEIAFMRGTDMAVVISQSQGEIAERGARRPQAREARA
jgi:type I restriction enzyme, R subunit